MFELNKKELDDYFKRQQDRNAVMAPRTSKAAVLPMATATPMNSAKTTIPATSTSVVSIPSSAETARTTTTTAPQFQPTLSAPTPTTAS